MKKKKLLISAGCLAICTSIVGGTAFALSQKDKDDLMHIRDVLLEDVPPKASDDIDGDGRVDSFDLALLRRQIIASMPSAASDYSAVADNVKLTGRTLRKDDVTWLVQSGSAVEFTVTGKSAIVTLAGDGSIENGEDYRSRYAVIVDDKIVTDDVMSTAEKDITLFEGEVQRTAKVCIIHLSEANNGSVGVKNIHVDSTAVKPVVPEPEKELKIEFIGDSITCAYGVEGQSAYENFKTTTENFMKSYAYLTAKKLDADYSAVSYSGHGIISGYTSGDQNTDQLVPKLYENVGNHAPYTEKWDFSKSDNDVVVINLGTNDNSYLSQTGVLDTAGDEFINAYVDFLEMVREKNPKAYIICTMGTMGGSDIVYPLIEKAVEKFGDKKTSCYESVIQNYSVDGIGSDWHPSEATQQNSAYVLADKICNALGIESDQIGLNVAADAKYELITKEGSGANCYAYFNDYDKSYWISNMAGGSNKDDLEVVLSPVGMKKNGVYHLEFDWSAEAGSTVPVIIRCGETVIYEGTIAPDEAKIHFSDEFTSSVSGNAEIVFQVGGYDSARFTIENFKLTKKG